MSTRSATERRRHSATAALPSYHPLSLPEGRFVHGSAKFPPSRRWTARIIPSMPTSKIVEYFEPSAKPKESPVATRSQPEDDRVYSHSRYRVETVKKAAPTSVFIREECAIRLGSKAASAIARTAAVCPHRRYAHHPQSPTKAAPKRRVGRRP